MTAPFPTVHNKHHRTATSETVYIGRGSKWGNPFAIGRHGDRAQVIASYEAWLRDQHHLLRDLHELRGRDVVCFCAPASCHGEILVWLANSARETVVAWWRKEISFDRGFLCSPA